MILGQDVPSPVPSWLDAAMNVLMPIPSAIADAVRNAVHGGRDVQAEATAELPQIPEGTDDATGAVGASKAIARKPSAAAGDEDTGYYEGPTTGSASVWPWLLGVGLIAGGAYWFVKRRKRSKRK